MAQDKRSDGEEFLEGFVPTGRRGLRRQMLVQNLRMEFPKNDLNIYFPTGSLRNFGVMVTRPYRYGALSFYYRNAKQPLRRKEP